MALAQSTVERDPEVPAGKKYAVNAVTGAFFITHIDMFDRPKNGVWKSPDNLEFFGDERLARARQKEVLAVIAESRGDPVPVGEPDAAPEEPKSGEKDWTKISTKPKLAEYAKERYGLELNTNRTFKNMQAQFISGSTAINLKMDAVAAIRGAALMEGDQFPDDGKVGE
jgi:hypothetical protein